LAGISLGDFLKQKFDIKEAMPNEVMRMEWPASFVPLFDFRAKPGLEYIRSRGIDPDDGLYYDTFRNGIVFPLFFQSVFVGAQIRLIDPSQNPDGRKIDTLTGTRSGLLFYNWDQSPLLPQIRAIVITEGAFDSKSIEQAMMKVYGGILKNPWKCIATSGSGVTRHHMDTLRELKESGIKVIVAPDSDKAGIAMFDKLVEADAITHYAFTEDSGNDWNRISQTMGKEDFSKFFLSKVQSVKRT
jgi:5S rRNA maturation endonuclease (ribonuclease M5)